MLRYGKQFVLLALGAKEFKPSKGWSLVEERVKYALY